MSMAKDVVRQEPPFLVASERREWQRVLVNLEVDYGNEDNYLLANIRDISVTGIFVCTTTPEEAGTRLNLRFTPNEFDFDEPFDLEGEVIWVNQYRPGDKNNLHPGMGIRFTDITADDRKNLERLVKTIALLD